MNPYWVIGIAMAAGLQAHPHDCSVNVYVITGVAMPGGMLLDARLRATRMFREIGVNLRMRMGRPAHDPNDTCGAPIMIQLEPTTRYPVPPDALAYALPYKDGGACIHVFLDRVSLNRTQTFANALLAHVMVHEIGHVLEQMQRHSAEGVMKPRWSAADYQRMERDALPFAPEDVESIREGLLKRATHAGTE